jgi:hypothetical protein
MKYKTIESYEKAKTARRKGTEATIKRGLKSKKLYEENPKFCVQCGEKLPYEKRKNSFCSNSCAATRNNNLGILGRKKRKTTYCGNCGNVLSDRHSKYCSIECWAESHKKQSELKNKELYEKGLLSDERSRLFFRRINADKKCSICGLDKWMEEDIPLEVDHIDGNSDNNFPNNLRYVCCNCAAQLPTYKSRNKGNGRQSRRKLNNK